MPPSQENPQVKSSFPGLRRYTGKRNVFADNYDWLQAKRRDDDVRDLWRVHDKLYNLSAFISKHPGGADWIELTRGTDITEAFEASHMVNVQNVEKILDKYFVEEITTPRNSPYTFKPDGFYMTLKRRAEPVIKKLGTGPTKQVRFAHDMLCMLYIGFVVMGTYLESLPMLILAGLVLTFSTISAHNLFHLRDTWRRYYFDLSLMSSLDWRISHALSHHMFPNTLLDAEITLLEPYVKLLPKTSKTWLNRYASLIYFHVLAVFGLFTVFLKRLIGTALKKYGFRPEILIPMVEIAVVLSVAPSFLSGCKAWLLVHTVCSYSFSIIALKGSHHHYPECFHDGDEARPDPDFGLCQLDAVADRIGDDTDNTIVALATFGHHTIHHLFPTVCHSKLMHLRPLVMSTLTEFQEDVWELTSRQFFTGTYKQVARITPNLFKKSRK